MGEHRVEAGAQAHDAPAHVEPVDVERGDAVVHRIGGRRAAMGFRM